MRIKFRTLFWAGAAVAVAALLVIAFRPQPIAVDMTEVARGPLRVTVRDEGRTRVRNEFVVSAPVAGQLLRVELKPGATVSAGETIARILPSDPSFLDARSRAELEAAARSTEAALALARAELDRAEAQLAYAQADAARLERLRSEDLTSQDSLDRAHLDLRVAEADVGRARENSRMREADVDAARARLLGPGAEDDDSAVVAVTAPVTGRVLTVAHESASVIFSGAEIMTLGDPADLEVVAEFLSTDAVKVEPGASALIENWGGTGPPLRGRVRLVEPYGFLKISALGVEEQRVNVVVDFVGSSEDWASLGHGYRVEVAVVTWEADDVLRVPIAALFRDGERWAVYRVEDGEAQLVPVEVGHDNGLNAEILSGVEAGDTIILYPSEQVFGGVRVVAREA
jgi:HlyD family secretion protein